MAPQNPSPMSSLDPLFCREEHWDDGEEDQIEEEGEPEDRSSPNQSVDLLLHLPQERTFQEQDDLCFLLSKEQRDPHHIRLSSLLRADGFLSSARRDAVDWMLRVCAHYSFAPLTAILSVSYLDRFIAGVDFQEHKPWLGQLSAVACLSLAAKVEETRVPLLLDLQVEDVKYMFEAKTVKRMELLVLSTLGWRMNPVTPLCFIEHIIRRQGLQTQLHWEFLKKCERLILSVIADPRCAGYLPSVFAAATMLQVIHQMEPDNPLPYENQILSVLNLDKETVKDCLQLMLELSSSNICKKRKNLSFDSVLDLPSNWDGSGDSWFSPISSPSSPLQHSFKKSRAEKDQQMLLPSIHCMFIDVLSSP